MELKRGCMLDTLIAYAWIRKTQRKRINVNETTKQPTIYKTISGGVRKQKNNVSVITLLIEKEPFSVVICYCNLCDVILYTFSIKNET